jgi:hypothetical protein
MSFWTKISLCVLKIRGFKGGIGVPKPRGSLNSTGAGLLNHQTSKNSPISFWTKNSFLVYEIREFEGGIGVSKCGGSLNSTGQGLLNLQKSKNSPNGGGIGDLCGGGGGGHYIAWRGLGVWHRNPRDDLRASFGNRGRGALELTGEHNGPIITGSPGARGR